MGKEVGGRSERSVRHPAGRESPSSLFIFFAKRKKKKYYLEQEGSGTKLLFQEQYLLRVLCPLNQSLGFFRF